MSKRFVLVAVLVCFGLYMFGCKKKDQAAMEMQEPLSMETLSAVNVTTNQVSPETKALEVKPVETKAEVAASVAAEQKLEPLPPAGPYKPSAKEIQTALKNANFYAGEVDGKIGPKTKAAIEEFQRANGLKVDGKVGPQTWQAMSKYLAVPAQEAVEKR